MHTDTDTNVHTQTHRHIHTHTHAHTHRHTHTHLHIYIPNLTCLSTSYQKYLKPNLKKQNKNNLLSYQSGY